MTLEEIRYILDATVLTGGLDLYLTIEQVYCADLMSDVLAFSFMNSLLITGLTNTQAIRTAEIADIRAIVFTQNKLPDKETISLAANSGIPLLATGHSMFDTCGILYECGLRGKAGQKV